MTRRWIEETFPRLRRPHYRVTSPIDPEYNCCAWAAGETERWWDPTSAATYWPEGVPRNLTVESLVQAFETLGYTPCDSDELEQVFEKVAIYVDADNVPTHVARQLPNGRWSSKLGRWEDIEHRRLDGLTGPTPGYGSVAQILTRPITED